MAAETAFDYYYGDESNQFSFYRIPRQLITGDRFKRLSTDAKLLYGLLLDRMGLSAKNGWYDEQGRVFIYYTLDEMKKLIKADLSGILRLAGAYQAVEALDVEREVAELQRSQHTDYFFLARNGRCRLSTLPAVYEPDTPANLDWLACRGVTPWPVVALYLHTDKTVEGLPWGSVTLLDQQAAVEDVRIFSALPESQRERHIRLIVKRYQRHVTYCSMLEAMVNFTGASIAHSHFRDCDMASVSFQDARLKSCLTLDCTMNRVDFRGATLDGASYGRITAKGIQNLPSAAITQGGATREEVERLRVDTFRELGVPMFQVKQRPLSDRRAKPHIPER